ncbi:MAG: type IV pilin N-terminal domain-containing protein [Nitrososphaerota archaeon]|nr:type IV pilin N-terminal domain-containing protein [Nitrososphaerota archaeon]
MNFEKVLQKKRKAISPVLATVILIAITLIAAVAIAGFVFGLFGTFSSSANVQAAVTSASHTGATGVVLSLTNIGTSNTQISGAGSITFGGANQALTCTPTATNIVAGGPLYQ